MSKLKTDKNSYVMNNTECPKCLGIGEVFDPIEENEVRCNLCRGKGKVSEEIADSYNPLEDLLREEDFEDEDDEFG